MSRHHFHSVVLLPLFMMMCCGTGGYATAVVTAPGSRNAKETYFAWRDKSDKETVSSLRVPSLVEMNGDVFAVAEAQCKEEGKVGVTGIASKLLTSTDESSKEELDKNKLKTQVLEECPSEEAACASQKAAGAGSQSKFEGIVARPTTVVHGSDIYMLAGIYVREGTTDLDDHWGLLLARGNVSVDGDDARNKRIYLTDVEAFPSTSNTQRKESLKAMLGSGGSGVRMNDDTLVFPVEGMKANEDGAAGGANTVSLIIYSTGNEDWKLSKDVSADGCSDPSVVEWEKDKLMMMTACDDGRRRVYESGEKGDSWTEALGTLSRVWFNKHTGPEKGVGSGFIKARIEDRDVMLVTLPVYARKDNKDNGKGVLHLWLTDNTHIVDIGSVSEKDDDVAASSLL
ncbi:trans-sialidase, partial [Trypanosoma cruzi]